LEGERDNDNSILFIFGRYIIKPNISPYFEFIIDEFQTKKQSMDKYPNSLGIKIGIDGLYTFLSKDVYFNIEYNKLDNWTYVHGGQFTNWQNRDHSIGYPYGSDLWSYQVQLETWASKRILLSFDWLYLQKGNHNLSTYWEAEGNTEMNFPSKPISLRPLGGCAKGSCLGILIGGRFLLTAFCTESGLGTSASVAAPLPLFRV